MIQDFLIPFIAVGLAELGDKTQLAVVCLASKTKKYLRLLLGVVLAFAVADGLAILLGDFITEVIPLNYIKLAAGVIFIIFGILTLINNRSKGEQCDLKSPFISGFCLVLLSEMGDKTQIASGLFATQFNPWIVFIGIILVLSILSAIAVYLGKFLVEKLNRRTISIAAAVLFIVIGVFMMTGV